jgi:hypothetical protein
MMENPPGEEAPTTCPRRFWWSEISGEFVSDPEGERGEAPFVRVLRPRTPSPEVITFDELNERARFVVHQHEAQEARALLTGPVVDHNRELRRMGGRTRFQGARQLRRMQRSRLS